ncbi:hypothetical protein ACFYPK_32830 [Streptomyces halstedii]|uniref:hypothetical protein n=1 Tax=Streptomyces halstedii TaxID=1944 RepID=UPI00345FD08E
MHRMTSTQAQHTRRVVLQAALVTTEPTCPKCGGTFETCRCMGVAPTTPQAGPIEDIEREDDRKGYEPEEVAQYHQLVARLVVDGDVRAKAAGRRARRTLADMMPGYKRQPVLRLTRPLPMRGAGDSCPVCRRWNCDPANCPPGAAPGPVCGVLAGTGEAR